MKKKLEKTPPDQEQNSIGANAENALKNQSDKKQIQLFIFEEVKESIEIHYKDARIDRLNQIKELLQSSIPSTNRLLDRLDLVLEVPRKSTSRFPIEFYREIYRLNGWDLELSSVFRKKREVAIWTRELIYGRFRKEVILNIEIKNPYVAFCKREHFHYQFLNEEGSVLLVQIINQAIELMSKHKTWKEFRKEYVRKYNLPHQLDLFED